MKKIEKLPIWEGIPNNSFDHKLAYKIIIEKINQIIDYINSNDYVIKDTKKIVDYLNKSDKKLNKEKKI